MKLTKGHTYNVSSLTCSGWTPAGADTTGYNAADYFTASGEYLGADEDGIEPTFSKAGADPNYSAYTVQVSTEPGYYGSQCTDEDAQRIAESIRDLIQGEFPGITAELWNGPVNGCSGKTTGPDPEVCEEINEWCAENWTAAL